MYGSSPVEQPALHTTMRLLPLAVACRTSSGSTWLRSARICGGLRKKYVSGMVTSSSSAWRSTAPAADMM